MHTYSVKRGINLTMPISDKKELANAEVTFFVNNAHTIVHVVLDWSETGNFRERIPGWLKGVNDHYLEKWLAERFNWILTMQAAVPTKPRLPSDKDFTSGRISRRFTNFMKRS